MDGHLRGEGTNQEGLHVMRRQAWLLAVAALVAALTSAAIEPAYRGPLGNPEEPALRPYKAFWRGLKALKYHTLHAAKEGDQKVENWGYVESVRGVRRGLVELLGSTYLGMAGSLPEDYRQTNEANQYLEKHTRVRVVADAAPVMGFLGLMGAPAWAAVMGSVPVAVTQVAVDNKDYERQWLWLKQAGQPVPEEPPTVWTAPEVDLQNYGEEPIPRPLLNPYTPVSALSVEAQAAAAEEASAESAPGDGDK